MNMRHLAAALVLALPMAAIADQCSPEIAKIDELLANPPAKVPAEDVASAKLLREEAVSLRTAGKDVECVATTGLALELLGDGESG
ncbi:MAG: hypothetical protein H6983_02550 [Ectothiorhodospiraceae bacterium]|nr:hypothetical protein [Ectothiorhodospiraceae bacterium]